MRLFSHLLVVVVPAYSAPDVSLPLTPPVEERGVHEAEVKVVADLL